MQPYITPTCKVTEFGLDDIIVTSVAGVSGNADIHLGNSSANQPRAPRRDIFD